MARGTTLRNIRIDDETWAAVKAKAAEEGIDASTAIRRLIEAWLMQQPSTRGGQAASDGMRPQPAEAPRRSRER